MGRPRKGWTLRPPRYPGDSFHVRFTSKAGKRVELSTGTDDPREASIRAAEIYARDLTAGTVARPRINVHLPLDELFALWLADMEATLDKKTCETYAGYAKRYIGHFGSFSNITKSTLADYQRGRLTEVLASSVRKERSALNGFLDWCVEQGVLGEETRPEWPKLSKKTLGTRSGPQREAPVDVTLAEVNAFLAALPQWSKPFKGAIHAIRNRFIVQYETGLRPALVDALEVPRHWKPGAAAITITPDIDKVRYGRRVPITERARLALDETVATLGITSGPIFGEHDHRHWIEKARVVAGLPEEFAPYDLRHGRAGHLVDATGDMRGVAFLLGHTQLTTTNRYLRGQERNALNVLGSGAITGFQGVAMLGAKEEGRTLTGVTPLEPESGAASPVDCSYESLPGQEESKKDIQGQGNGASPKTLTAAAKYLAVLRADWDVYDALSLEGES